jgi:hypothetical protein
MAPVPHPCVLQEHLQSSMVALATFSGESISEASASDAVRVRAALHLPVAQTLASLLGFQPFTRVTNTD